MDSEEVLEKSLVDVFITMHKARKQFLKLLNNNKNNPNTTGVFEGLQNVISQKTKERRNSESIDTIALELVQNAINSALT